MVTINILLISYSKQNNLENNIKMNIVIFSIKRWFSKVYYWGMARTHTLIFEGTENLLLVFYSNRRIPLSIVTLINEKECEMFI